jgi:hypothetical protein
MHRLFCQMVASQIVAENNERMVVKSILHAAGIYQNSPFHQDYRAYTCLSCCLRVCQGVFTMFVSVLEGNLTFI